MKTAKYSRYATAAQFMLLSLAWGSSFLFIKVGLAGLSPQQVVLGRLVAGALTLIAIAVTTRCSLPRQLSTWGHLTVVAMTLCVAPFLLFAWAEQYIGSGLASIYNAATPLMTALISALALRNERLSRHKVIGLATGALGVIVVLGVWHVAASGSAHAQLACLGATALYGFAFAYLRRFVSPLQLDSIAVAVAQVSIAAAVLLFFAPFFARTPMTLTWPIVVSVVVLGVFGTGLAYIWNTNLVAAWGATNASAVTYATPVVGTILGIAVLDEEVTWNQPLGAVIIALGIVVLRRASKSDGVHDAAADTTSSMVRTT